MSGSIESCNDEDQGERHGRDWNRSRSRDGGSGRRSVLVMGIGEDAEDEDVTKATVIDPRGYVKCPCS